MYRSKSISGKRFVTLIFILVGSPLAARTDRAPADVPNVLAVTVSTSTATNTSTTIVPGCGNGVREGTEQCDPGPPGSPDRDCCSVSPGCFILQPKIGQACGPTASLRQCEVLGTCSDEGQCSGPMPALAGTQCRAPSPDNPCDVGDFCDGTSPDCPTAESTPCTVDVNPPPPKTKSVRVVCEAPKPGSGRPQCEAVGRDSLAATGVRTAAGTAEQPVCGTQALTATVSAPLRKSDDPNLLRRRLKLKLNDFGRKLFRDEGSVEMCVTIKFKFAGRTLNTETRLVTLTK